MLGTQHRPLLLRRLRQQSKMCLIENQVEFSQALLARFTRWQASRLRSSQKHYF